MPSSPYPSQQTIVLALLLLVPLAPPALVGQAASRPVGETEPAPTSEEALFDAARAGDVERLRVLLDAGVPVDATTEYGVTPLAFATREGHVEAARLLLDRGADPDAEDRFYGMTPVQGALAGGEDELVLLMLEHGTDSRIDVLELAVGQGKTRLVEAALEGTALYVYQRELGVALAEREGHDEIARLLRRAEVRPLPDLELDPALLASYAGVYRAGEPPEQVEIVVTHDPETGRLVARGAGAAGPEDDADAAGASEAAATAPSAAVLLPVGDGEFRVEGALEEGYRFRGRSGTIEGLIVSQGIEGRRYFPRADEDGDGGATETASAEPGHREPAAPAADTPASPHWPSFRGTRATGLGTGEPPVSWDVEKGENVLWKTEIPGLANSSPIVWGDAVYLTTAVAADGDRELKIGATGDVSSTGAPAEHTWKAMALDKATGEILWSRDAGTAVPETERHFKSTHANPTPATDGRHVVALFPTAGLYCYDTEGELLWSKDLGALDAGWFYDPTYDWGYASSPVLWGDSVIVQADVEGGGWIAAFALDDGRELWRTERDDVPTWSTPTVVDGPEGPELVTNGRTIRAYDPQTGRELWRLGPNSELPIATPIATGGLVVVTAGYPPVRPIYAVRPGARGDLTLPEGETSSEAVAWSLGRGGAYMPTPLAYRGRLWIGHHNNRLVVHDAGSGEILHRMRFSEGGTFTGSPVAAAGRIYFPTEEGTLYTLGAGDTVDAPPEELAANDMGEIVMTTPAISDGVLYVRTRTHLWALGEDDPEGEANARTGDAGTP